MKKRCLLGLLALLLCLTPIPTRAASSQKAKELTSRCEIDFGGYPKAKKRLLNRNLSSRVIFDPGAVITLSWGEDLSAACLCLQWYALPEGVIVRQLDGAGALVAEEPIAAHPESVIPLSDRTCSLTLMAGQAGMTLSQLHVYGSGTLPSPFHLWQETPEQLDYLVIATHPDDDILYLGSVVPIYGAERGYVGTVAYVTCRNRTRMTEAENGAWTMGLRYHPLFMGFPDISRKATDKQKSRFSYEELLLATVRLYRRYHPAVVFAQDVKGEYGHWQHKLTVQAALEAFDLAADPAYDPGSRKQYGLWQVQKLYLHMYPENVLRLNGNAPLQAFGGTSAWNVARKAYQKHVSQKGIGYAVERDDDRFAFNRFGMAKGVVAAGDDAFENVPAELLSTRTDPPLEGQESPFSAESNRQLTD